MSPKNDCRIMAYLMFAVTAEHPAEDAAGIERCRRGVGRAAPWGDAA